MPALASINRSGTLRENNVLGIRGKKTEKDLDCIMVGSDDDDEVDIALQKVREIPLEEYLN